MRSYYHLESMEAEAVNAYLSGLVEDRFADLEDARCIEVRASAPPRRPASASDPVCLRRGSCANEGLAVFSRRRFMTTTPLSRSCSARWRRTTTCGYVARPGTSSPADAHHAFVGQRASLLFSLQRRSTRLSRCSRRACCPTTASARFCGFCRAQRSTTNFQYATTRTR